MVHHVCIYMQYYAVLCNMFPLEEQFEDVIYEVF